MYVYYIKNGKAKLLTENKFYNIFYKTILYDHDTYNNIKCFFFIYFSFMIESDVLGKAVILWNGDECLVSFQYETEE